MDDEDEDDDDRLGTPAPGNYSAIEGGSAHFKGARMGVMRSATPAASSSPAINSAYSPQMGKMGRSTPRRPSNLAPPQYMPQVQQMASGNYSYSTSPQYSYGPPMQQYTPPLSAPSHALLLSASGYSEDRRHSLSHPITVPSHYGPNHSPRNSMVHSNEPHRVIKSSPSPDDSYLSPPSLQTKNMHGSNRPNSIFTPIEDSRSLLAQHWVQPASPDSTTVEFPHRLEIARPQSVDAVSSKREESMLPKPSPNKVKPLPKKARLANPDLNRPNSNATPHRTKKQVTIVESRNVTESDSEAKRPRLKVHIPHEGGSDAEASASESSLDAAARPAGTRTTATTKTGKSVVLPPPSPSNNALLSAGATGPGNPFARPAPPSHSHSANNTSMSRDIETPLSALPSRVMEGNMLPSPSDIWGSMFSSRMGSDGTVPSPLNFQPTPIATSGGSFAHEETSSERKRRADYDLVSSEKRIRT